MIHAYHVSFLLALEIGTKGGETKGEIRRETGGRDPAQLSTGEPRPRKGGKRGSM